MKSNLRIAFALMGQIQTKSQAKGNRDEYKY